MASPNELLLQFIYLLIFNFVSAVEKNKRTPQVVLLSNDLNKIIYIGDVSDCMIPFSSSHPNLYLMKFFSEQETKTNSYTNVALPRANFEAAPIIKRKNFLVF